MSSYIIIAQEGAAIAEQVSAPATVLSVFCTIYFFMLLFYAIARLNPMKRNLSLPLQMVVIGLAGLSLCLSFSSVSLLQDIPDEQQAWIIVALASGVIIISLLWIVILDHVASNNAHFIYLLARRSEELLVLQMANQRMESEDRYQEAIQTSYESLRSLRHDIRNQMIGLRGLLEQGDSEGAAKHLARLQSEIVPSEMLSLTKIPQVDAILSFKMQQAAESSIKTDFMFIAPDELPLDPADCCSILGNILDNAIEGAMQVATEDRYLLVEAGPLRNMWRIRVENACTGKYRRRGNTFLSTKEKEWHGVGLKHTQDLVEANDGYVLIDAAEDSFSIEIYLPWASRDMMSAGEEL